MANFIDIHTHHNVTCEHIRSFRLGIERVDAGDNTGAAVHPWDVEKVNISQCTDTLKTLLKEKRICCLSETGLDFAVDTDKNIQRDVFEKQLAIAKEYNVPVFIHSVRANDEVYNILRKYMPLKCVIHGFIGNDIQAQKFIGIGAYLSVSLRSLKSAKSAKAIKNTPLDRLFCESDDWIEDIKEVYTLLADIKGVDIEELKRVIKNNYKKLNELV